MRRLPLAALLAVVVLLLAAQSASAAAFVALEDGSATVAGAARSNTSLTLRGENGRVVVAGDGIVAGSGCTQDSPTQASCPEVFVRGIFVKFGFANDTIVSEYNGPAGVGVDGSAGDDSIDVRQGNSVEGSSGNDTIVLRGGSGLISGGPGNDTITVASGGRIPSPSGDDGNDTMSVSGFGEVGTFFGGTGNDRLTGGPRAEGFNAGPGIDTVRAGDGDDSLFLRDGEADACFDVGGGSNRVDADLVDQAGTCLDLLVNVTLLTVGARRERPNVLVRNSRLDLGSRIGVNLHCPRRSGGCAGTLRLTNARGRGVLAATRYSLRAGRRGRAVLQLSSSARRRAARLERARVTAVEKGVFGPKTTVAVLPID